MEVSYGFGEDTDSEPEPLAQPVLELADGEPH